LLLLLLLLLLPLVFQHQIAQQQEAQHYPQV
jgi:hypothetical protein